MAETTPDKNDYYWKKDYGCRSGSLSATENCWRIYNMLDRAFEKYEDLEGLIIHSDNGWQYQHFGYRKRL